MEASQIPPSSANISPPSFVSSPVSPPVASAVASAIASPAPSDRATPPASFIPAAPDLDAPGDELGAVPDLETFGFESPGAQPTDASSIQDLLVYGLIPHETRRPDLAIVLGVAAELEAITAFAEGPMQTAFELLARRLRAAVALSTRMSRATQAESA
jgi:hypothetical protein